MHPVSICSSLHELNNLLRTLYSSSSNQAEAILHGYNNAMDFHILQSDCFL
jgi:hypothetical protein